MPLEIERKYLVNSNIYKLEARRSYKIIQGYLSSDSQRTVRVRIKGNLAFLTIKGSSDQQGLSRYEWEKEIPVCEAEELMKLCLPGIIEKTRFEIIYASHIFEVDEFYGENDGLIVAEVELASISDIVELPLWIDREVTGDSRYYNASLIDRPFGTW